MYPTKSMIDYMTEMNRLFPRGVENDIFQTSNNASHSPSSLSTVNRSSSSTDSTSPETFPDLSTRSETISHETYDTPFVVRRQRPIVGRRIMSTPTIFNQPNPPKQNFDQDMEFSNATWQPDESLFFGQTPPNSSNRFIEQKSTQNSFYELFPTENKGFEFQTPIKTTPRTTNVSPITSNVSLNTSNYSPNKSNYSPDMSNYSYNVSNSPNSKLSPLMPHQYDYAIAMYTPSSSKYSEGKPKLCTFCRKNGETPLVYMTHTVKQKVGHRDIVTCPILRSHVCSTCGASGDDAHTITYCPVMRQNNNGQPLQSTTITLKNTRVKSNGRRRY